MTSSAPSSLGKFTIDVSAISSTVGMSWPMTVPSTVTVTGTTSDPTWTVLRPYVDPGVTQISVISDDGTFFEDDAWYSSGTLIREFSEHGASVWQFPRLRIPALTPAELFVQQRQQKLQPVMRNHRGQTARNDGTNSYTNVPGRSFATASPQELRALGLLRQLVGPDVFRLYLKDRAFTIEAPSGLRYRIFRNQFQRIEVYAPHANTKLAELCIHVRDNVPPTDEVIAKVLMVQCDEPCLWAKSNVTRFIPDHPRLQAAGFAGPGYTAAAAAAATAA